MTRNIEPNVFNGYSDLQGDYCVISIGIENINRMIPQYFGYKHLLWPRHYETFEKYGNHKNARNSSGIYQYEYTDHWYYFKARYRKINCQLYGGKNMEANSVM